MLFNRIRILLCRRLDPNLLTETERNNLAWLFKEDDDEEGENTAAGGSGTAQPGPGSGASAFQSVDESDDNDEPADVETRLRIWEQVDATDPETAFLLNEMVPIARIVKETACPDHPKRAAMRAMRRKAKENRRNLTYSENADPEKM